MNLSKCDICPRKCGINREKDELGFCQMKDKIKIARYSLHYWEEPIISGETGSGTIFFSGCNLKCIFCQNYKISSENIGKEISVERLKEICLELQNMGASNINLVTGTHFLPLIKEALILAKKEGLTIPIVYNTSSYANVESLKVMEGLIDIYLPDLKYYDNKLAENFSLANNYFKIATNAIKEMVRQTGKPVIENNIMKKGVIVRHLLLPNHLEDSKKIIKYLHDTYNEDIYISIMNQYTPIKKFDKYPELNRTLTDKEYDELVNYACDLNITQAFIQEGETCKESFIPDFTNYDEI